MADPRNSIQHGRHHPPSKRDMQQTAIAAAAAVAAARLAAPPPQPFWDDDAPLPPLPPPIHAAGSERKFYNPVTGIEIEEWEHDEWVRNEEDSKIKTISDERDREARRDEIQYKTAFRTAFELGMKAGRMQRAEPLPCQACERRKERNRIAAQASRLEKRRLERLAQQAIASTRRPRKPTGGELPPAPPTIPVASSGVKRALEEEEKEDSDTSYCEAPEF